MKTRRVIFLLILILIFISGCNNSLKSHTSIKTNEANPTITKEPESTVTQRLDPTVMIEPEEDIPGISKNYLILLETSAQTDAVLELKEYKEARGYKVTIKCVDKDIPMEKGKDASEIIHKFLKELDKELSLDYVLFIGEPYDKKLACPQNTGGIIPMKYMYFYDDNHNTRYNYDWYNYNDPSKNAFNTPSDIYYVFDCDWDYDKDGYAGERLDINGYKENIGEPLLMFYLGRIPFSDSDIIKSVLTKTITYESNRKEHSNALIASGILVYPENEKFHYTADGAYYADIFSNNLTDNGVETVTLYEKSGVVPSLFECTYPLSYESFQKELNKNYDLTYTLGHGGYSMELWTEDSNNNEICDESLTGYDLFTVPPKKQLTGFFFMDGCHSMRVESDSDNAGTLHIQDFIKSGMNCAALATTRDHGFNAKEPARVIASLVFSDQNLIISKGFYEAAAKLIFNYNDLAEAYIYCYLGDPSMRLKQ